MRRARAALHRVDLQRTARVLAMAASGAAPLPPPGFLRVGALAAIPVGLSEVELQPGVGPTLVLVRRAGAASAASDADAASAAGADGAADGGGGGGGGRGGGSRGVGAASDDGAVRGSTGGGAGSAGAGASGAGWGGLLHALGGRCPHSKGQMSVGDIEEAVAHSVAAAGGGSGSGGGGGGGADGGAGGASGSTCCIICPRHRKRFEGGLRFDVETGQSFLRPGAAPCDEYRPEWRLPVHDVLVADGEVFVSLAPRGGVMDAASTGGGASSKV